LGDSAISCLEIEALLFSSYDIAFAMSEGWLSLIDYRNFLANSPLMMSFEAIIKSDGHPHNVHISNAGRFIVPKCRMFRADVSQYLLINIKVHKESDDYRFTSS
jgi:hypothetical protein